MSISVRSQFQEMRIAFQKGLPSRFRFGEQGRRKYQRRFGGSLGPHCSEPTMINLPIPSLEESCTDRLRFRKAREADAELWLEYINNAEAVRFMHLELTGIDAARQFIQWSFARYGRDGSGLHSLELLGTGEFVGLCGLLTQEVDGEMELEIGYHLLPSQWHKGFATEAAVFCKAFACERALAPSVISLIDPDNLPSQRVAQRNGLQLERTTSFRGKSARVYRGSIG